MKTLRVLYILILITSLFDGIAMADFIFGEPMKIPNINSEFLDSGPRISSNGLELYFHSDRPNDANMSDTNIWVSKRSTTNEPWPAPVILDPPVNSQWSEASPCPSTDGLELYFTDGWINLGGIARPGGIGGGDLWVSRRASKEDPWGEPENLGQNVNSAAGDDQPSISADGLSLYFMSNRGGYGYTDIYVTKRQSKYDPWETAVNLGASINSNAPDSTPYISPDGLSLFFSRGGTQPDIYVSKRTNITEPWIQASIFNPVNFWGADYYLSFSKEDSTLYLSRADDHFALDSYDNWQVKVTPIVDLNGDGIVDIKDILTMTDFWSENYSLCDIAPMPCGDGTVDTHDLIVLAMYMPPSPKAHWALDETEGDTAHNSVNGKAEYVIGNPVWRPNEGKVNGAIELDGVDDCIIASCDIDPTKGPFSAFAWIKGGEPDQVIISHSNGVNWLAVDTEGKLMTELKGHGRNAAPLLSQVLITDGQWHRIGFVWDGSQRMLCVDGVTVAKDIEAGLDGSAGSLYIGAGKDYADGTFFSGLIDDVRIYNVALSAEQILALTQ